MGKVYAHFKKSSYEVRILDANEETITSRMPARIEDKGHLLKRAVLQLNPSNTPVLPTQTNKQKSGISIPVLPWLFQG